MDQAWKLGNHFGLVPLVLPIGLDNPVERVYEVRRRMNELKGSTQPLLAFAVLTVAGLLVKPAQDAILRLFADKTTAVMTNVPGPRDKLRLLRRRRCEHCMFWVPQSGNIGLGVSILSYGGNVQFGVITDAAAVPPSAEDHRRLRAGVRQAVLADADAAVGGGVADPLPQVEGRHPRG